jgi:hypothetical protein
VIPACVPILLILDCVASQLFSHTHTHIYIYIKFSIQLSFCCEEDLVLVELNTFLVLMVLLVGNSTKSNQNTRTSM